MVKLLLSTLIKFICGILLVASLLFISAGELDYFGGWLLLALLFIPMLILGSVLFIKSPELLKKRLNAKEKMGSQSIIVMLSALIFVAGFVIAGLDCHYGWTKMPIWATVTASTVFLISYGLYAEVMR